MLQNKYHKNKERSEMYKYCWKQEKEEISVVYYINLYPEGTVYVVRENWDKLTLAAVFSKESLWLEFSVN